jgi:predicted permease
MPRFWRDYRHAARTLVKSPAYSLVAVATLALGIGANTSIFSVVNQVLLNPAGISDPDRVVALRVKYEKLALLNIGVSVPDFADVRNSTDLIECAALVSQGDYNFTGSAIPERLRGANVSYRWFDVFGARPRLGRAFQPEEDKPNANRVVVLSYPAWQHLYGEDPKVIGRTLDLNQTPYRIIGVMGPEFRWPAAIDLWVPLGLADAAYTENNRFNESYNAVARLKAGVAFPAANAFVQVLSDRERNSGTQNGGYATSSQWGMFLMPFTEFIAGNTRTPMLVLVGAVGFVLLIACSNIAGLTLARASGRSREIAVRAALGARRWDLIRQTFAESVVLSFAGAVTGLALAFAGVRGLLALAPQGLPVDIAVRMDSAVLAFTALAAMASAILFGVAPAWHISRLDRYELLKEGARSNTAGLGRQQLRSFLVIAEVALALLLLVGAGLFLRSLAALQNVNPGFQPGGVITGGLTLPRARYADNASRIAFYRAVLDKLSQTPGATEVAAGIPVPFSGMGGSASFGIEGRPSPPGDPGPHGDLGFVTASYFSALRIPVIQGRVFNDGDRENTQLVAVVDETLAQQYWLGESAVGKHIRRGGNNAPWYTIVGIVGHIKNADLAGDEVKGKYYFPLFQVPPPFVSFLVRTPGDPGRLAGAMRESVLAVDPTQPLSQIRLLPEMVNSSLAPRRFVVTVLAVFAGMALLMAVIGLYGVVSYAVTQRTQEMGVRMALGAQATEIQRMVISQGLRLAGVGALVGLVVSLVFSRLLRNELFHVNPFDPLTFAAMAAVLVAAALLASYLPARRATRVAPMVALRYE